MLLNFVKYWQTVQWPIWQRNIIFRFQYGPDPTYICKGCINRQQTQFTVWKQFDSQSDFQIVWLWPNVDFILTCSHLISGIVRRLPQDFSQANLRPTSSGLPSENLLGPFSQGPRVLWEFTWSPPFGNVLPPTTFGLSTVYTTPVPRGKNSHPKYDML